MNVLKNTKMRWKERSKPNLHETRIIQRYLWFPTEAEGEWRWLERAHIKQRYVSNGYDSRYWYNVCFMNH